MGYRLVKEYKIFYVSNDGLLKKPDDIYEHTTYSSEEEATEDALKKDCYGCVILPFITRVWED